MREHMVIDATGWLFLAVVCLGVPYLALRSNRRLGTRPLPMSRRRFFLQTIFAQLYLVAIAVVAAQRNGIDLLSTPDSPLLAWTLAAAFVGVMLAAMWFRWPSRDRESKERLYRLLPQSRADLPLYFLVSLAAGICEEIVYRGVATTLLDRVTENLVAGVFISAAAFAIAHIVQGKRAAFGVFGVALMAQSIVLITQSLLPAMAAHAAYDAVAGVLMSRRCRRELESAPQPDVLSQTTPIR
jgi:membrane protease YdiL (CAAX protease family)